MGPKPSAPFQGQFVKNQVDALLDLQPAYFYMRWHNDSLLNRVLKYPVLWLQFFGRYVLSRTTFDLIHVHYFYPTIWLALTYRWLRNPKVKIVVTCHGSDIYLYQPESAWYKFAAKAVDYWIFTSEKLKQRFFNQQVANTVLPAGIHPVFGEALLKSRTEKTFDLLYVGSLDHNKGMDRLLALLPALFAAVPTLQIAVVGQGSYRSQLATAALQYPGLLLFSPKSPAELQHYYQDSRCFLSLSRNESFGLVMTEAMACYTPVIATDTDGSQAQINHGVSGYMLSQQDEAQLQRQLLDSIQLLLTMPAADYLQLQLAGRQDSEQYLVSQVAGQLQRLYQSLLDVE
ncbi:glycosyltransferase [Rheinheimera riviphila]|uniref:Glycosyltransferase n=2 Tax=Rheinheimera riviphila TaxID=1834037 RepID=A0A437R3W2_9GAMM|nr:glycosyltransferase [Rheinheimera riviphila]